MEKIMQPIKVTSGLATKWEWGTSSVSSEEHLPNYTYIKRLKQTIIQGFQEGQQVKDQKPYIPISLAYALYPSSS